MEMICPECLGTIETSDGQSARCATHGGEFRLLFSHWQPPAPPRIEAAGAMTFQLPPGSMCVQHQTVPAVFVCQDCGAPVCAVCDFAQAEGGHSCPRCAARRIATPPRVAPPLARQLPDGVRCVQHSSVAATQQCKVCGAFMCATCDFTLPGGLHVCPACVALPRSAISSRRKWLLIGSYALAVVATVGLALVMSGAFAAMGRTKEGKAALGYVFILLVLVPALIGMALRFSAIDRRLANPLSIWIAAIWNLILIAVFLLMCVIGMFMK